MQQRNQVAAVINDDMRFRIQRMMQELVIFFLGRVVPGKNADAVFGQRCRDIILGRQRIAAGHHHIGAGIFHYHAQIGGFGFQMNGDDHIDPGQRFGLQKFFIQ